MSALMQKLLADKAKASLMLGLVAVLLLMWGRLMLKQVPRQAVAEPAATAAVSGATAGKVTRAWAPKVVEFTPPESWSRDLFVVDTGRYARNPKNEVKPVAKSDPQPSDELLESTVVKKAAAGLTLQTTMLGGDKPRAMIDGQVIEQGQQIRGFTLKKVESRWVVLEMNGIEVELGM
jgi:hypothetical protein